MHRPGILSLFASVLSMGSALSGNPYTLSDPGIGLFRDMSGPRRRPHGRQSHPGKPESYYRRRNVPKHLRSVYGFAKGREMTIDVNVT